MLPLANREVQRRNELMSLLTNQLKDEVYVFTSPGLASILMLKERASKSFTLMPAEENEDNDVPLQKFATRIRSELNKIPHDGKRYTVLNNDHLHLYYPSCHRNLSIHCLMQW